MLISSQDIFPFPERQTLVVRLPNFDWNFSLGALVILRSGKESVEMRQIGTGNHEGRAALLLTPTASWDSIERQLGAMLAAGDLDLEDQVKR